MVDQPDVTKNGATSGLAVIHSEQHKTVRKRSHCCHCDMNVEPLNCNVMGIGIVLLFWAILGIVVASIAAATLGCAAAMLTRGVTNGRRKVIIAGSLFPLVCLGWGGAIFVFQAVVNEGLLHRDLGLGDTWHAPLPNGYQIMMIDVTDQGWVYNPKTQPGSSVGEQQDAVAGVRNVL
jgi:hypothetical protein